MTREEALKIVRENYPHFGTTEPWLDLEKALATLIPELRESEDERVRKHLIKHFSNKSKEEWNGMPIKDILAWLEKQKYDRMKPIYDARESFESALEKAWNDYHNGYENVDKLEDDYVECAHAKGFREGFLYGLEKQKVNTEGDFGRGYDCGYEACLNSHRAEWLEKQKVFAEHGCGLYYYHNGGFTFVARPAEKKDEENPYDFAMSQQEKQKEQKPTDDVLHRTYQEGFNDGLNYRLEGTGVKYVKDNPKQEWSEEDEKRIKQLIYDTEAIRAGYEKKKEQLGDRFNDALIKDCDEQIRWLKSLRPQWKPSEEQMEALCYALQVMNTDLSPIAAKTYQGLQEIQQNLRKLM